MAGVTQEVRTIMYSEGASGQVVVHKFPFNANDPFGREKLEKFVRRGFTFNDPRLGDRPGIPQVVVTQEVDFDKALDGTKEAPDEEIEPLAQVSVAAVEAIAKTVPLPTKKWKNMNASERKVYQQSRTNG